jgi:hypothetical protein
MEKLAATPGNNDHILNTSDAHSNFLSNEHVGNLHQQ